MVGPFFWGVGMTNNKKEPGSVQATGQETNEKAVVESFKNNTLSMSGCQDIFMRLVNKLGRKTKADGPEYREPGFFCFGELYLKGMNGHGKS